MDVATRLRDIGRGSGDTSRGGIGSRSRGITEGGKLLLLLLLLLVLHLILLLILCLLLELLLLHRQ